MTFAYYAWGTLAALAATLAYTSARFRDPFHPAVLLAPMAGYMYGFLPLLYQSRGLLDDFPATAAQEVFGQRTVFLSVLALCFGLVAASVPRGATDFATIRPNFDAEARRRILMGSMVLSGIAMASYLMQIAGAGGFYAAYARAKGGGASLGSGYLNEAMLFCVPGAVMYLFAKGRSKDPAATLAKAILLISPLLLQGILGGRRGPTFLAIVAIGTAWFLARSRRPSVLLSAGGVVAVGLLMLFLVSHRRQLYLGQEFEVDESAFVERVLPAQYDPGDTTFAAWATIVAAEHHDRFYNGKRYFAQLFVRPIPRQIWATKYEDLGLGWMKEHAGYGMFSEAEWMAAVQMIPPRGTAAGLAADTFLEFRWGGLVCCFLAGLLYSRLWKRSVLRGGLWSILYLEAAAVSVFLVSQGLVSAWLYRLLFLAVPTIAVWRILRPRMTSSPGRDRLVWVPAGATPPPGAVPVRLVPPDSASPAHEP